MLFYRLGNDEKAFKHLDQYLKTKVKKREPTQLFHLCLRDYLKLKVEKKSKDGIKNILASLYGSLLSTEVLKEFSEPETIFENSAFPSCFHCETCDYTAKCRHFDILGSMKELHKKCRNADIDQSGVGLLF